MCVRERERDRGKESSAGDSKLQTFCWISGKIEYESRDTDAVNVNQ